MNSQEHGGPVEDEVYEDPLTSVAESVAEDDGLETESLFGNERPKAKRVLDPSINLRLTDHGVRQILGRKPQPRPKPLLPVTCKGCGRSTHDIDEFLESDWQECLGQKLRCMMI